jgi:hypothetical protein
VTSLRELLFAGAEAPQRSLRVPLQGLLDRVPDVAGVGDLPGQATAAILALLAMPLGNVALTAWAAHARVRAACEQTAREPGSRQLVRLLDHTIRSEQHPTVDLDVGGATRQLLVLTLQVEIVVSVADLVVEGGRVSGVMTGATSASAALLAGEVLLARGALQGVDLRS